MIRQQTTTLNKSLNTHYELQIFSKEFKEDVEKDKD